MNSQPASPTPTDDRPDVPAGPTPGRASSSDAPVLTGDEALVQTLWSSPYLATLQAEDFRYIDVNDAFSASCGYTRESLRGLDPMHLHPEQDREALQQQRAGLRPASEVRGLLPARRSRILDAQGRERWYDMTPRAVHMSDGRWLWLSVLQDVTAEHQARDAGQRAEDELETWFEMCPAGMLVFDDSGAVVRTNPAFESLVGASLMNLEDAQPALRWLLGWPAPGLRSTVATRWYPSPIERESAFAAADGRTRRLMARVRGLPGDDTRRRAMAVVVDRSAEEERDLARREIGVLMDTASIGVATFDPTEGWIQAQQPPLQRRSTDRRGVLRGGSVQGITRDMVEAGSLRAYERLQQALRQREAAEVRYAVNHPEGGRRWLLTRVEPQQQADRRITLSVVTLDVTDQEMARERNAQLLRELSTILEGSAAGIAYLRDGLLVRCNLRFERLLGLLPGEAAGATLADAFGRRFDVTTLLPAISEALQGEGTLELELPLKAESGNSPGWYALSLRRADAARGAAGGNAEPVEAVAALTDVSRLKAQAHELQAALRERAVMFDLSAVGLATMLGSRIERANQAMAELTGFAAAELTSMDGSELYESARDCVEFEAAVRLGLRQSGRFLGERRLRRRDGRLLWVQVAVRPIDEANPEGAVIASFVDVDERNQARQSLQRQAEQTRAVLDSVLVGIVTVSTRGIEWMNRSARRMFGGELADFVGQDIALAANDDPEHPLRRSVDYLLRLVEGQAETFECQIRARDGRRFWVAGNVVVTGQAQDAQLTYALLDIERRRQAETRIAQAQASLQRVIETAPLAIAVFDASSQQVLQVNQMAGAFFGKDHASVIGRTPAQCMLPQRAEALVEWLHAAALTPEVLRREWHDEAQEHGHSDTRVWDVRIVALAASDATAAQLLLAASDVTEQREAEQARLQAAIAQREVLVREVHHRIKNNLQGVAGLLQHAAHRKPELSVQLNEAVSQVHAIAQVYGLQVGSDGPLRVGAVVAAIAASVARTFGREVAFAPAAEAVNGWVLAEADAIPIALTINELLTNAVKHSAGAAVACGCLATEDAAVEIWMRNRAQLPAGFSLQGVPGGVSGLGLVRALLPRRGAALDIVQEGDDVLVRLTLRAPGVRTHVALAPESRPTQHEG